MNPQTITYGTINEFKSSKLRTPRKRGRDYRITDERFSAYVKPIRVGEQVVRVDISEIRLLTVRKDTPPVRVRLELKRACYHIRELVRMEFDIDPNPRDLDLWYYTRTGSPKRFKDWNPLLEYARNIDKQPIAEEE